MNLNDSRIPAYFSVSAAIGKRAVALRAAGQPLHAHALEYMLSSLSARDAPGDWFVLERLAVECLEVDREPLYPELERMAHAVEAVFVDRPPEDRAIAIVAGARAMRDYDPALDPDR